MVSRVRALVTAIAFVAAASAAAAQPAGRPNQGGAMSPNEIHQLFDAMMVMQAQDALALSTEQYAQFLTRLKVLQDTRRRNQQERVQLVGELQRLTNPRTVKNPDEGEVTRRLNALQELESRAAADMRRAYSGIDEVLNPIQQARFRVLEEQLERRKLELVGRARQNKQPARQPQRRPPGR